MIDTAGSSPPPLPTYVVDAVKPIGNGLYELVITLPGGARCRIILSLTNLTLANVYLATEAVAVLHLTRDGARPVLAPFP